jgi:hypothetical protein
MKPQAHGYTIVGFPHIRDYSRAIESVDGMEDLPYVVALNIK